MNIKSYLVFCVTLLVGNIGLLGQAAITANINVDASSGNYALNDSISFTINFSNTAPVGTGDNAEAINAANTANNFVISDAKLLGTDIYGNAVEIDFPINNTFSVGPGANQAVEASVTIPNDGTLHDVTQPGYSISLTYSYDGLGAPSTVESEPTLFIQVDANLQLIDLAYPSATFKGGDIIQVTATILNRRDSNSDLQIRPLTEDEDFRTELFLTDDASLDTDNDFLLGFFTMAGDLPVSGDIEFRTYSVDGLSRVRFVDVSNTPDLINTFDRDYLPEPDDSFLDIGETVTVSYEVLVPHNYLGSYFVAGFTDSRNEIEETEEGVDATFATPQNDNIFVDDRTPLIKINPTDSLDILPVSEVSTESGGLFEASNGLSDNPSIDETGAWITFHSLATNLDPSYAGTALGNYNIYLRELSTGQVQLISRNNTGLPANADSKNPVISGDGRYIAFESKATNLISGTTGAPSQIYVYDRENQVVRRVSITAEGNPADGNCFNPSISSDGRFVVFESTATNLDSNYGSLLASNNIRQIFIHDRDVNGSTIFTSNYDTSLVSELGGILANSDCVTPKVSLDGDVVVFATDATFSNTQPNRITQIWMRDLSNGKPSGDITLVSVNDSGAVAVESCKEPAVNAGKGALYGLQIAFASVAENLVANDDNGVSDIFVRSFPDGLAPSTKRVSVSNPRSAYGTITFSDQPAPLETVSLNDGVNSAVFTFDDNVSIGADADQTRSNLRQAINESALTIHAYESDTFGIDGSIMLYNEEPGVIGNQAIATTSAVLSVTGMTGGGTETGVFLPKYETGEALGSLQPSLDRTGRLVAYRSLVDNIAVSTENTTYSNNQTSIPDNETFNPDKTEYPGQWLRFNNTRTSKVYYIDRDISNSQTLDTLGNTDTVCASVNKFGYPTNFLFTPSSGSSRMPAFSADGRFIAFASDSTNTGGLRFNRTNTQPQDINNLRDVFLHVRPTRAPIVEIDENQPFVVMTNPTDGSTINFSSPIFLNAGAFGYDESLGTFNSASIAGVEFFVNGESVGSDTRTPFSVLYQPKSLDNLRIFARATDTRGNVSTSNALNVSVAVSPFETTLLNLKTPGTSSGDTFSVGDSIILESEILATAGSAQFTERYNLIRVSYLINGVAVYSTEDVANEAPDYDYRFAFEASGTTSINAMATYLHKDPDNDQTQDVFSETITVNVVGIDVANNDRDFINDAFSRLIGRSPTDSETSSGLVVLNSGESRASYIATLLDSSSVKNAETASFIFRTMTGEWPNQVELSQALADVTRGATAGDTNALTTALLPSYEDRFSALNTDLGFIEQTFINKHGVSLSSQNQIRLTDTFSGVGTTLDERIVPGYAGDSTTYITQFALDNDASDLKGPDGLPLSNLHLYEMPNDRKDDFKIALLISGYLGSEPTDELVASYSSMSLEQAIQKILSGGSSALASASSLGSDWYDSPWFGMFYMSSDSSNWVYSWRIGWVYEAPSSTPSAAWFYSDKLKAWLWSGSTSDGFYYYSSPSRKTWTYLLPAEANASGAWLHYFDTEQWQLVRP